MACRCGRELYPCPGTIKRGKCDNCGQIVEYLLGYDEEQECYQSLCEGCDMESFWCKCDKLDS